MFNLIIHLLERLGIFAIAFILIMRFDVFKRLLVGRASRYERLSLSLVFGLFGIAGTYLGVPVQNAIANSRVVGVVLGGILGGPLVGLSAGVIAGSHRFLIEINGFTSTACGVATIAEGIAGGILYHRIRRTRYDSTAAFVTGIVVETLQMAIILLVAKPFPAAMSLVRTIAFPMILVNSLGLALFVELVASLFREQERFAAFQAQAALNIALRTLPFLRGGLTATSTTQAARIILEMTDLDAVAFTDQSTILAHVGVGHEHHRPGMALMTDATRDALASGRIAAPLTREEIGCTEEGCRLGSAIIVPLRSEERVIGALKLYRIKENSITPLDLELAHGLAHLFSSQLELSQLDEQKKLVREAEIRALQAQIHPHFLFNAINTVKSFIRTNPNTASELLVKLAEFLRRNISPAGGLVTLAAELEHCRAYLAIEMARFGKRVQISYCIDKDTLDCLLPPLILQPLVENALRHGILTREEGGEVTVVARREGNMVVIKVHDNGVGMSDEKMAGIFSPRGADAGEGAGIALQNVNGRLCAFFGSDHCLRIKSAPARGTTVTFTIPADTALQEELS
jgi:two-component system sensor histidine kinase LytS